MVYKSVSETIFDILCAMSKRKNLDPNQKSLTDFFTNKPKVTDGANDDDDELSYSSKPKQSKHNQVSVDLKIERVKNAHGINSNVSLSFDFDFHIVGTSSRQIDFEPGNGTDVENAASTSAIGSTSKEKTSTVTTQLQLRISTTRKSVDSEDIGSDDGNSVNPDDSNINSEIIGKGWWILNAVAIVGETQIIIFRSNYFFN